MKRLAARLQKQKPTEREPLTFAAARGLVIAVHDVAAEYAALAKLAVETLSAGDVEGLEAFRREVGDHVFAARRFIEGVGMDDEAARIWFVRELQDVVEIRRGGAAPEEENEAQLRRVRVSAIAAVGEAAFLRTKVAVLGLGALSRATDELLLRAVDAFAATNGCRWERFAPVWHALTGEKVAPVTLKTSMSKPRDFSGKRVRKG